MATNEQGEVEMDCGMENVSEQTMQMIKEIVGEDRKILSVLGPCEEAKKDLLMRSNGPGLYIPCLWPLLLLQFPCIYTTLKNTKARLENTFYVVTDQELLYLVTDHENPCCSFGHSSGNDSKSIPFSSIVSIDVDEKGKGTCCGVQMKLSSLRVQTQTMNVGALNQQQAMMFAPQAYWLVEDPHALRRLIESARKEAKAVERGGPVYENTPAAAKTEVKRIFVSAVDTPTEFKVVTFSDENGLWEQLENLFGSSGRVLKLAEVSAEVSPDQIQNGDKVILG